MTGHRWSVASRVLAAIAGGYALTSLLTLTLSLLLPRFGMGQPQSALALNMASFLFYAAIIMAVFHTRTAQRVWIWMTSACLALGIVVGLLFLTQTPR